MSADLQNKYIKKHDCIQLGWVLPTLYRKGEGGLCPRRSLLGGLCSGGGDFDTGIVKLSQKDISQFNINVKK